ncbi:MAG: ATP-binding cassette domain-containing protein [Lachnospiraceae bacterium]|nr:ATP-binding cassette domain-containing protein [Lachnospiraceae bacterium]
MKNKIKKAAVILIWICIWEAAAVVVHNPIYFASPLETAEELAVKIRDAAFWQSVCGSMIRILAGFAAAFCAAFLLAFASYGCGPVKDFLSPFISFLKSVPVTAVVVILLIWWGPRYLVLCISMMVVFPNIYMNMLTGLGQADRNLLEMATVFGMKKTDIFLWIYRPACLPALHSAVSVSLGMCFKSGVAAEIIGLPEFSIGERLYRDKIYLNTAGVFAWIVVILALSALTEKLIMLALKGLVKIPAPCIKEGKAEMAGRPLNTGGGFTKDGGKEYTLYSNMINKSYDGRTVTDTAVALRAGQTAFLKAPSGAGKTTLLKILAGIVKPDKGSVERGKLAMVFQEDRLIGSANGLRNLKLAGCAGELHTELAALLPERTMMLPASELSGGERRRLAIARAMLHPSDVVIMDEPFAGLDEESKQKTIEWIKSKLAGRSLIIASHGAEEELFGDAEEIKLK